MKSVKTIFISFMCLIIWGETAPLSLLAKGKVNTPFSGKVIDARNKKGLANVSVSFEGTDIGTVTNSDGYFSLYCNGAKSGNVSFTTVGYSSVTTPLDSLSKPGKLIMMEKLPVELSEVVVYGGDPVDILTSAIKKIPDNYSVHRDMLSMFYRETIRKGRRFIGVSEAAMNVFKTPYSHRIISSDRVQIERGRRLVSQKSSDTLAVKIMGGPNLAVNIDIVKNADLLFNERELTDFKFNMEKPEYIGDRLQYVISFKPNVKRDYAQFKGRLYVDRELLAFTRAEFEMMPDDKKLMTATVLHKKPKGLRFNPQKINFVVSYKYVDGKTYLNYISNEMRFKCDMRRRLFSSSYTAYTEMVVVEREENTDERISNKEAFKPRQVFYDLVDEYWEEDYWSDYNIIEPTESLENAVEKLKKGGKVLSLQ